MLVHCCTVHGTSMHNVQSTVHSALLYRLKGSVRGIYEINNGPVQDREAVKKVRHAVNTVDCTMWCSKHCPLFNVVM